MDAKLVVLLFMILHYTTSFRSRDIFTCKKKCDTEYGILCNQAINEKHRYNFFEAKFMCIRMRGICNRKCSTESRFRSSKRTVIDDFRNRVKLWKLELLLQGKLCKKYLMAIKLDQAENGLSILLLSTKLKHME